jgi:hypothetical protein
MSHNTRLIPFKVTAFVGSGFIRKSRKIKSQTKKLIRYNPLPPSVSQLCVLRKRIVLSPTRSAI